MTEKANNYAAANGHDLVVAADGALAVKEHQQRETVDFCRSGGPPTSKQNEPRSGEG